MNKALQSALSKITAFHKINFVTIIGNLIVPNSTLQTELTPQEIEAIKIVIIDWLNEHKGVS